MSDMPDSERERLTSAYIRWQNTVFGGTVEKNLIESTAAFLIDSGVLPLRVLPEHLRSSLMAIPAPSFPTKTSPFRPASVVLKLGERLDAVYFMDEVTWFGYCLGFHSSGTFVPVSEIESVAPSPLQIPPKIANKLHKVGETAMCRLDFVLRLKGGRSIRCFYGGSGDFIELPGPHKPSEIRRVKFIWDRPPLGNALRQPRYAVCVHLAAEETVRELALQEFVITVLMGEYLRLRRPLEA